jgi:hypothetical protein
MNTAPLPDISDAHYADVIYKSLEAYEKFLKSGDSQDLKAWVELDREKSKILNIRQAQKAREARIQ